MANEMKKILVPMALLGVAAFAQKKVELTARELFYIPTATAPPAGTQKVVVPTPAPTPAPRPVTASKAATPVKKKTQDVAAVEPPKPSRSDPDPEPDSQGVKFVTVSNAAYEGPRPLGMRYSVMRVIPGAAAQEVPVSTVFRTGDSVRVKVEANEPAYLYVLTQGTSGKWQVLFPSKDVPDNFVAAGKDLFVPGIGNAWTFSGQKGEEKLFLVLSRQEVPDLESLIHEMNGSQTPKKATPTAAPKAPAPVSIPDRPAPKVPELRLLAEAIRPIDDPIVGRSRTQMLARDLIMEQVNEAPAGHKAEAALYVVEKSGRPDAKLVVEAKLKHQ